MVDWTKMAFLVYGASFTLSFLNFYLPTSGTFWDPIIIFQNIENLFINLGGHSFFTAILLFPLTLLQVFGYLMLLIVDPIVVLMQLMVVYPYLTIFLVPLLIGSIIASAVMLWQLVMFLILGMNYILNKLAPLLGSAYQSIVSFFS